MIIKLFVFRDMGREVEIRGVKIREGSSKLP